MRIGFAYHFNDCDWLGGKNYFSSLFTGVRAVAEAGLELVLFTGTKTQTELPTLFPWLEVVRTPLMDRRHPWWILRQLCRLPSGRELDPVFSRLLRQRKIDVLSHAWGFRKGSTIKSIGWLPDFQFMRFPDRWSPQQIKDETRIFNAVCRHCDTLILSSAAALVDLHQFSPTCKIPVHILHFVSNPVQIQKLRSKEDICDQYSLPPIYLHLPNQFWSIKNHGLVIEALRVLKDQGRSVTVACTGKTADGRQPEYFEDLMAKCRVAGVSENFRVLGLVPYEDVQALMFHCRAVVNPSKSEGWSTSVEEAKMFGKDMLLSNIAVHKEQVTQGGFFFDPDRPSELARHMLDVTTTDEIFLGMETLESRHHESLLKLGFDYISIVNSLYR